MVVTSRVAMLFRPSGRRCALLPPPRGFMKGHRAGRVKRIVPLLQKRIGGLRFVLGTVVSMHWLSCSRRSRPLPRLLGPSPALLGVPWRGTYCGGRRWRTIPQL